MDQAEKFLQSVDVVIKQGHTQSEPQRMSLAGVPRVGDTLLIRDPYQSNAEVAYRVQDVVWSHRKVTVLVV